MLNDLNLINLTEYVKLSNIISLGFDHSISNSRVLGLGNSWSWDFVLVTLHYCHVEEWMLYQLRY